MPFTTKIVISLPEIENGQWETLEPLNFHSILKNKNYIVEAGFLTDLASVPRLPLTYAIFGGHAAAAAVLHDWLYQHGMAFKQISNRQEADEIFLEAMLATNFPAIKANAMFYAVRMFGWRFFKL